MGLIRAYFFCRVIAAVSFVYFLIFFALFFLEQTLEGPESSNVHAENFDPSVLILAVSFYFRRGLRKMIKKASFLAFFSCAVFSASCYAGQYAQALGDCVYDNLSREDKNVMTQWAFVTLGKTDAAKQITVIPESKIKQVNKEAKKRLTRLMTEACAREAANVALHESKNGLQDAAAQLGVRLAKEQLKGKTDEALANLLNPGTANVLRGAEVLKGFFKKPQ